MRLFIGIPIVRKSKEILLEFQKDLPRCIAGTFSDQLHITLKFLGEVEESEVGDIHNALSAIQSPLSRCGFTKLEVFERHGYATMLVAGVESTGLNLLHELIEAALAYRFQKDERAFFHHITLARIRAVTDKELFEKQKHLKIPQFHFDADHFILYRSHLNEEGSTHEVLHTYHLEQQRKELQKGYRLPPLE